MAKYIDRTPPSPTGDKKRDEQAIYDYLSYMREQLNYILQLLYKNIGRGD